MKLKPSFGIPLREYQGGDKINIPFSYYDEKDARHAIWKKEVIGEFPKFGGINVIIDENIPEGKILLVDKDRMAMKNIPPLPNYDPGNISGKKLAEIGRWVLEGKKAVEKEGLEKIYDDGVNRVYKEADYTNIGWLNMRVDEICRKGRL